MENTKRYLKQLPSGDWMVDNRTVWSTKEEAEDWIKLSTRDNDPTGELQEGFCN